MAVVLLVDSTAGYWSEECPDSYFGPLPLQSKLNITGLDCSLKALAVRVRDVTSRCRHHSTHRIWSPSPTPRRWGT